MDVPRLVAMNRFWRTNPPLREMVQAYLGIKIETPTAKPTSPTAPDQLGAHQNTEQDVEEFAQMFNAIGGSLA